MGVSTFYILQPMKFRKPNLEYCTRRPLGRERSPANIFDNICKNGDIFGWHLSLGVALVVTLLIEIPDMIFFEKMILTLRERF